MSRRSRSPRRVRPTRSNWPARRRREVRRRRNRPLGIERFEPKIALAVTPTLVADINQTPIAGDPADFLVAGGVAYFTAFDLEHGRELWKTDGTSAGTTLVADVVPGPQSSNIGDLAVAGGTLFFTTNDYGPWSGAPRTLWSLDPTTGTPVTLATDVKTEYFGSSSGSFGVLGDELFFWRDGQPSGQDVWKTDGTVAGTSLVAAFPDTFGINISWHAAGGRLFFAASDQASGNELWSTDGTTTSIVKDIAADGASSLPAVIATAGDVVFFKADDGTNGSELWRTDPVAGAVLVADLAPGFLSSSPSGLLIAGNQLFVKGYDDNYQQKVWRIEDFLSDTPQTTAFDLKNVLEMTVAGDFVYLAAEDGITGNELWRVPLAGGQPELVKNIYAPFATETYANVPGVLPITQETEPNDSLAQANDLRGSFDEVQPGVFQAEVYRDLEFFGSYDYFRFSLPAGYQISIDQTFGVTDFLNSNGDVVGSGVKFLAEQSGEYLVRFMSVSYSLFGITTVFTISPGDGDAFPSRFTVAGDTLYFIASDRDHGSELWRTDAVQGAVLVQDLAPGPASSGPSGMTAVGNEVFFLANGNQIWKASGAAGAVKQGSIGPDSDEQLSSSGSYASFALLGGKLLFAGDDGASGEELWAVDTATGATNSVKDIGGGNEGAFDGSSSYGAAAAFNGLLYFAATDEAGTELWRTDGTEAGTQRVADINPGTSFNSFPPYGTSPASSSPSDFTPAGDVLYFTAKTDTSGRELWKTTGLPGGTVQVADIVAGGGGSFPTYLTPVGNTLYFAAYEGNNFVYRLWKTDGSTTQRVTTVDAEPRDLAAFDGSLFFAGHDATYGTELRRLDVTTGAVEVFDFTDGFDGSEIQNVITFNGNLYFTTNIVGASKLWRFVPAAGGQPAGRELVKNFYGIGLMDSEFNGSAVVGDHLYFRANDGTSGTELWRTDGTAGGTVMVKDIDPGTGSMFPGSPNSSYPRDLTASDGKVYFMASDATGQRLWQSDGSAGGTMPVEFTGVSGFQAVRPLGDQGGQLLLKGQAGVIGTELWALAAANPVAPSALAGLVAVPGDGQVKLSWTAPASGGSPITDYVIEYSNNGGANWLPLDDGTSSTTSATVTSLTNNVSYVFRVAAVNAIGTGPAAVSSPVTPKALTVIESAGSVTLGSDAVGELRANGTLVTFAGGPANYQGLIAAGWTPMAADVDGGKNTVVLKHSSGALYFIRLNNSWVETGADSWTPAGTTQFYSAETRFGVDFNGDTVVGVAGLTTLESAGSVTLAAADGYLWANQVPIMANGVQYNSQTLAAAGWTPVAADVQNGTNTLVLRHSSGGLYFLRMNSSWVETGADSWTPAGTAEFFAAETLFGVDFNGDSVIGLKATTLESAGNVTLAVAGGYLWADDSPIKANGSQYNFQALVAGGWTPMAAEEDGGINTVVLKHSSGALYFLRMDSSWNQTGADSWTPDGTAGFFGAEVRFGVDFNGDTFLGVAGLTALETAGSVTLGVAGGYLWANQFAITAGGSQYNFQALVAGGWTAMAAERDDTTNTLVLKHSSGALFFLRMDEFWVQIGADSWTLPGTPEFAAAETRFGVDFDGDGHIGSG